METTLCACLFPHPFPYWLDILFIYVCMCMHRHMYIFMYIILYFSYRHLHIYIYIYTHTNTHIHTYAYKNIHMPMHTHTYIYKQNIKPIREGVGEETSTQSCLQCMNSTFEKKAALYYMITLYNMCMHAYSKKMKFRLLLKAVWYPLTLSNCDTCMYLIFKVNFKTTH